MSDSFGVRDRRNGSWLWVNTAVVSDPHLTAAEKIVYAGLASFGGCEKIFPSVATLVKRTSTCRRTVQGALRRLEDLGYIKPDDEGKQLEGPVIYILMKAMRGCKMCRAPAEPARGAKSARAQKRTSGGRKKLHGTGAKSAPKVHKSEEAIKKITHARTNGAGARANGKRPFPEEVSAVYLTLREYEEGADPGAAERLIRECRASGDVGIGELCREVRSTFERVDLRQIQNPVGWLLAVLPTHFDEESNKVRRLGVDDE